MYVCTVDRVEPVLEKHEAALLILLGFGGFSVVVAVLFNYVRKYVFRDSRSLDTVFDAGGRVTFSLTSVVVTSQMLWPSDFLQNSTLVNKVCETLIEPRCEKTNNLGFRSGPTQTGLCSYRSRLEA